MEIPCAVALRAGGRLRPHPGAAQVDGQDRLGHRGSHRLRGSRATDRLRPVSYSTDVSSAPVRPSAQKAVGWRRCTCRLPQQLNASGHPSGGQGDGVARRRSLILRLAAPEAVLPLPSRLDAACFEHRTGATDGPGLIFTTLAPLGPFPVRREE